MDNCSYAAFTAQPVKKILSCDGSFTILSSLDIRRSFALVTPARAHLSLHNAAFCLTYCCMTTKTTLDLVCCIAVEQQSCERSWPHNRGLSISMLVQLCSPSFLPSSIILFLFSLFLISELSLRYGGNGKREWSKKKKRRKGERWDILQGIVGTHW